MSRRALGLTAIWIPLSIAACSGGSTQGGFADGGTSSSEGEEPSVGASSSSSGTSGACVPRSPPASSLTTFELEFAGFDAAGSGTDGWRTLGHDRDEQCSTASSAGVCRRPPGATSASLVDGEDGIDNAFGKTVIPLLQRYTDTTRMKGKVVASAGRGQLSFEIAGGLKLDIDLELARLERNGTSAVLSGLIPTSALANTIPKVAGRLSKSLCSRDALDALVQAIVQASDIGDGGGPDPSRDCDHITIGAKLTGLVTPTTVQPPGETPPDPCTQR